MCLCAAASADRAHRDLVFVPLRPILAVTNLAAILGNLAYLARIQWDAYCVGEFLLGLCIEYCVQVLTAQQVVKDAPLELLELLHEETFW